MDEATHDAIQRLERRVSSHGQQIDELRLRRERDSVILAQVNATCLDIKGRLDELEVKPAKRWEGIVSAALNAMAVAMMAYVMARLGLG